MKKLIFTFLIFALSHTAFSRPNEILIYTLIAKRCDRYLPEEKAIECQETVATMLDLLDYDLLIDKEETPNVLPESFTFVAFKKNLIDLLSDPATTQFLEIVNVELNEYLLGKNEDFNLWNLTLTHYPTQLKASQIMAVLFQDISPAKLHLMYLEKALIIGRQNFKQNKELLDKTIDTINMVVDYSPENFQNLFYPQNVGSVLNRNIYHFYVPFHLSLALQKNKFTKKMSFIAPFMMTLTYEFITTAKDFRYLFADPENLDPEAHAWKLKDIYGGYCGVNQAALKNPGIEMTQMSELFKVSTHEAVVRLIE